MCDVDPITPSTTTTKPTITSFFLPKLSMSMDNPPHHVIFHEPVVTHFLPNLLKDNEEEECPETLDEEDPNVEAVVEVSETFGNASLHSNMVETSTKKYDNLKYIFRKHIPMETLYHILDQICVKKDKYYLIDFNAFRLLQFRELYPEFSKKIIDAYKPSKQYFVTRPLSYNSFITIVRHICRVNRVDFNTKFNYQHSQYNIDYYIYHQNYHNSI